MIVIKKGVTIIKRHGIMIFFIMLRFFLNLLLPVLIYIGIIMHPGMDLDVRNYLLVPILLILINYTFIRLVLDIIGYNFNIILFIMNKVILIRSTLMLIDDVEIVDISKIMKVDVECRGIIPNLLGFGHLTIEQQKNDVKVLHFVPSPYEALKVLETRRDMVHSKHPEIRESVIEKIKKSGLMTK